MLVHEFLENSARRSPDKTALVAGSGCLAYRELDSEANRLALALRENGTGYGDRVVVFLDNCTEAVISIFGILKADSIFSVINHTTKADKLAFILENCRPSALITHRKLWHVAGPAAAGSSSLRTVIITGASTANLEEMGGFGAGAKAESGRDSGEEVPGGRGGAGAARAKSAVLLPWEEAVAACGEQPPRKSIDIDLAALIYTSGTTGNPKGVMLTHRNIVSASTSITTYLENREDDIILNVLPLSFDYGLYQVIMTAQFGGTIILEKTFLYPYAVINLLKKEKVTGFPIVPTISAILLQLEDLKKEDFEHLRYITNTAAALPVNHIRGLREIFPRAKIYSMYGLTECKRVSYLPPEEVVRRPASVGRAMPNEQVYLVDEQDRVISEPGGTGELVVRGANVMKGYWEMPEETAEMLRQGRYPWEKVLYTGDLFRMDEEGFLFFVARKDDIIKSRGEKVSPKEVESAIYELPDVLETTVIGTPDEILGEAVKAYVVLKKGSKLTEKDVISHCKDRLEDFMVPKIVEFRDDLPKTSSGKLTRKGL